MVLDVTTCILCVDVIVLDTSTSVKGKTRINLSTSWMLKCIGHYPLPTVSNG